jgi:hypothetical protein
MPYFTLDAETILSLVRAALAQLLDALHRMFLALVSPCSPAHLSADRTSELAHTRHPRA